METKKYLTEENYQRSNEKVKKIGKILIIIGAIMLGLGIILLLSGFLGFGSQVTNGIENGGNMNPSGIFSGIGLFALGGFIAGDGGLLLFIGLIVRFLIGNRREITAYTTQQVMPIAKEGIEEMAPTIGNAAKEIAKGIKQGINEADK